MSLIVDNTYSPKNKLGTNTVYTVAIRNVPSLLTLRPGSGFK